jgi:two-component system sensor histidine kinase KdpD
MLDKAAREGRSRLKVFLGAAPGVGKTYAMLLDARERKREGVDVVIGLVETHGRAETEMLLAGMEIIPRRIVTYRGTELREMDLPAILARRPQLVLVDELAHTNAPDSLHPRRYLDVEEILNAGIDVYTTVNIQHLESLNDVVAQITGVRVRETLPDRLIERADEIKLIDLPPEELLKRLREGKVYVPAQAERAMRNFFRLGNLNALRQLALRLTAEQVDEQMQSYMSARAIPGPWPASERILVCVGRHPFSEKLVRYAKRMAERRGANWVALHVETPLSARASDDERNQIAKTLRLAEELGGEAVTIPGENIADDMIRYAQQHNVTEIVIGKAVRPQWKALLGGSVLEQLIRKSGNINIRIITEYDQTIPPHLAKSFAAGRAPLRGYVASAVAVALAGLAGGILDRWLGLPDLSIVFLTAVLYSALQWGLWPSLFASLLSLLVYDFFFVPPIYTFTVDKPRDVVALIVFMIVAVFTSRLAAHSRDQADAARRRESLTSDLYAFIRDLAAAAGEEGVCVAIVEHVARIFHADVVLLLREHGKVIAKASSSPLAAQITEGERAAAIWAFEHGQPAGRGTETLPGARFFYFPLSTAGGTVGMLAINFEVGEKGTRAAHVPLLEPEQRRLLEAIAGQAALAIERGHFVEKDAGPREMAGEIPPAL